MEWSCRLTLKDKLELTVAGFACYFCFPLYMESPFANGIHSKFSTHDFRLAKTSTWLRCALCNKEHSPTLRSSHGILIWPQVNHLIFSWPQLLHLLNECWVGDNVIWNPLQPYELEQKCSVISYNMNSSFRMWYFGLELSQVLNQTKRRTHF